MAMKEKDQIIKENNYETKMGLPCVLEAFTSIFETGVFLTSVTANLLCWERFAT
ncbi:hypothetical protein Godav_025121 [Gossypium davidsonii]|uniref:Uncharacterized protein n=1 Tax=Gossypium davidsonii TaxID=34287 RepID=A0A7J8TH82_GOSDV|nr:hypothetical protein [Gossypium davidsonii]